jgi:hypothetical protein
VGRRFDYRMAGFSSAVLVQSDSSLSSEPRPCVMMQPAIDIFVPICEGMTELLYCRFNLMVGSKWNCRRKQAHEAVIAVEDKNMGRGST